LFEKTAQRRERRHNQPSDQESSEWIGQGCDTVCCLFLPKCLRVAKKTGDADQEVAKECQDIGWGLLQIAGIIILHSLNLVPSHAPLDTAGCCACTGKSRDRFGRANSRKVFFSTSSAYGGNYVKPAMLALVRSPEGQVLYRHSPEARPALDPRVAYLMVNLLEEVQRSGSSRRQDGHLARRMAHVQRRDGRWCIVDLIGKLPVPAWVKVAIDPWTGPPAWWMATFSGPSTAAAGCKAMRCPRRPVWQMLKPVRRGRRSPWHCAPPLLCEILPSSRSRSSNGSDFGLFSVW
jgi:hypothetical protein